MHISRFQGSDTCDISNLHVLHELDVFMISLRTVLECVTVLCVIIREHCAAQNKQRTMQNICESPMASESAELAPTLRQSPIGAKQFVTYRQWCP